MGAIAIVSIETSFRWSVVVVALMSFSALAITGAVHGPAVVAVYGLIFLSAFRDRLPWTPSYRVWAILSVACLIMSIYAVTRKNELTHPLVYYVIYLKINRVWNLDTHRDYAWLYAVCFFEVVFATLFINSLVLMFIMTGFVMAFAFSLILYACQGDMDRTHEAGSLADAPMASPPPRGAPRLSHGFIAVALALAAAVVALTAVAFPLIPRTGQSRLLGGRPQAFNQLASGFSDDVHLGAIVDIQMDESIVMRLRPLNDASARHFAAQGVRLRGLSLRDFNWRNNRWHNQDPSGRRIGWHERTDRVVFPRRPEQESLIDARIIMEPQFSDYLFAPVMPHSITLPNPTILSINYEQLSARFLQAPTDVFTYTVSSLAEDAYAPPSQSDDAAAPDGAAPEVSPVRRQNFSDTIRLGFQGLLLQLSEGFGTSRPEPVYDDSVADEALRRYLRVAPPIAEDLDYVALAESFRVEGQSDYATARAIEYYLRNTCDYSLQFSHDPDRPPILSFLLDIQTGHCELFASSMAMLLRSVDIPARMVNGFVSTEWNPFSGHYIIRQKHAHSWVEVWIDDYGWMTFDPTPPAYVSPRRQQMLWFLERLEDYYEALRFHWYFYVVDYGAEEQRSVMDALRARLGQTLVLAGQGWARLTDAMKVVTFNNIIRVSVGLALALAVVEMIVMRRRLRRRAILQALHSHIRDAPPWVAQAMEMYDQILRRLAGQGVKKAPAQTPEEFAQTVADANAAMDDFPAITSVYYRIRYGGAVMTARERQDFRQFADRISQRMSSNDRQA